MKERNDRKLRKFLGVKPKVEQKEKKFLSIIKPKVKDKMGYNKKIDLGKELCFGRPLDNGIKLELGKSLDFGEELEY